MPLYEYQCKECGLRFERRQHFGEAPIKVCPDCGGSVVRLIQPAGIIFKGSGFYVTDHRTRSSTAGPRSRKTEPKPKDSPAVKETTAPTATQSSTESKT